MKNPKRLIIARVIYRLLWWPVWVVFVVFAIPSLIVAAFADWCTFKAFPFIGEHFSHPFAVYREWVMRVGNIVWGGKPTEDD